MKVKDRCKFIPLNHICVDFLIKLCHDPKKLKKNEKNEIYLKFKYNVCTVKHTNAQEKILPNFFLIFLSKLI